MEWNGNVDRKGNEKSKILQHTVVIFTFFNESAS